MVRCVLVQSTTLGNKGSGVDMEIAAAGDVILVAGKGHENYQILADRTIHFDDREVVQELAGGKS